MIHAGDLGGRIIRCSQITNSSFYYYNLAVVVLQS